MKNRKSLVSLVTLISLVCIPWFVLEAKAQAIEGVVNLNTGTVAELTMLPGIGPAKAQEIVTFRQAHPFTAVSELTEVPGIGPKVMEKIQPYLTLQGPTTIHTVRQTPAPASKPTPPTSSK